MTVIIAHKFWKVVAVIADCRVSYQPPYDEVDDYLQKIYHIENKLVMGFAGPVQGAYKVMELVRKNLQDYSKPLIADNLQADVERWIRHRYGELDVSERNRLSFILATVEPGREKQSVWFSSDEQGNVKPSSKPSWFPYVPEWRIMALKPSHSTPTELVKEEKQYPQIIGVTEEDRKIIETTLSRHYGFAFKQPELQMQAILGSLKFQLMARQTKKVGGLFQCAMLSENGLQWLGYAGENVILEPGEGQFVQRNILTGQTLPLMTVWEWAKKQPPPGSLGAFEDPGLEEAVERLQRLEENSNGNLINSK
ncbi:MAG: hypothetical protein DRJ03_09400 [Chloroflexi bacterium]|nr:MAG: hypothetical protein DRI81_01285 [Chloroflexota bacterium]RLC86210.1 MAG: hypothetical protein DRJ03_09400 [Chloroflexota bacterium]